LKPEVTGSYRFNSKDDADAFEQSVAETAPIIANAIEFLNEIRIMLLNDRSIYLCRTGRTGDCEDLEGLGAKDVCSF